MGPPADSQVISTEFQGDVSGVDSGGYDNYPPADEFSKLDVGDDFCLHCHEGFKVNEKVVQARNEKYHIDCFVCAQCFQPFPDGVYYDFDGRKYCEHDFHVLFAPCCGKCGYFIVGRVIKAMNSSWHPECFRCQICDKCLADDGFVKHSGRALCHECNAREKANSSDRILCFKCHSYVDETQQLKYQSEVYHAYHFTCSSCGSELSSDAREKDGDLYCLRCFDKMGIPICGACRRPIEERVVHALGKTWHVEHFVCARCEKPFLGSRHYEKKGLAYCELHYQQLFGMLCYSCNQVIPGETVFALNKAWCVDHFGCVACDRRISPKTKFYEFDLRPVCKSCYEMFPIELRKRIAKMHKLED
ncbi:LIM domain-containing protein unc-97 [Echinococcus granulosus]|uniref:LIM domain-containing protein n=1 Tax=Echinococcus granulosus TaxID=6210 RepID=W6UHI7_ECHGR|nr:LIM domain-containing protein unc-97 [Echinococcus granulosus]EUB60965.1 LIM domain-containing protein unc-97 [Echinococcus granulosus]